MCQEAYSGGRPGPSPTTGFVPAVFIYCRNSPDHPSMIVEQRVICSDYGVANRTTCSEGKTMLNRPLYPLQDDSDLFTATCVDSSGHNQVTTMPAVIDNERSKSTNIEKTELMSD
jgi:hypothetical protein